MSNHLVTEGRKNSLSNYKQHQNQPVLWIHIMQLCFTVWPVLICLYTSFHRKHTSAPQIHVKPFPYFYQVCAFTKVDAQNKHDQILNLWLWLSRQPGRSGRSTEALSTNSSNILLTRGSLSKESWLKGRVKRAKMIYFIAQMNPGPTPKPRIRLIKIILNCEPGKPLYKTGTK